MSIKVGQLIYQPAKRDAIHVAVAPVVAAVVLKPGQHIGFLMDELHPANQPRVSHKAKKLIGIVDPFLESKVKPNDKLWMFLYPGSIQSLRHDWVHPAFNTKEAAREWLEDFANYIGVDLDALIQGARDYIKDDSIMTLRRSLSSFLGENREEFWCHFETYTGEEVPETDKYHMFFTCSCG